MIDSGANTHTHTHTHIHTHTHRHTVIAMSSSTKIEFLYYNWFSWKWFIAKHYKQGNKVWRDIPSM